MNPNPKPVHELRLGHIKAPIWLNETPNGPRYNTTFTRLYFDKGQWHRTDSFGRDDLLLLAKVADLAHSWICQQTFERNLEREPVASAPAS